MVLDQATAGAARRDPAEEFPAAAASARVLLAAVAVARAAQVLERPDLDQPIR